MTNNPTKLLMDEHDIIYQVEKSIISMDLYWEKDEEKFKTLMSDLLHFFREYSDRFHHVKEEEILFPELINHPDFLLNEIIDELEEHHEMFREYTKEIEELLSENQFEKAYKILKKYLSDLLDHIAIENDELFSITENLFSEDQLEKMYFRFKDVDIELGEEEKVKLESFPKQFQSEILK